MIRIFILIALITLYVNWTCQTSTTQETLAEAFDVQLNSDSTSYKKSIYQFIEDGSGNLYEIGRNLLEAGFFVRKLSSTRVELWTGYYAGYYSLTKSAKLISSDSKLALMTTTHDYYYVYIEIDVSDGTVNHILNTNSVFRTRDNLVHQSPICVFSPSGNYSWMAGNDLNDGGAVKLAVIDTSNPTAGFSMSKFAASAYTPLAVVALSDTTVIASGVTTVSFMTYADIFISFEWATTPTINWSIKIMNLLQGQNQSNRIIPNSDQSQLISLSQSSNYGVVVHVFNATDGNVIKKGASMWGFTSNPSVIDSSLIADTHLYVTARNSRATLLYIDITSMTGRAYTSTDFLIVYTGISPLLSDNVIYISRHDSTLSNYRIIKFDPFIPSSIASFEPANDACIISEITNGDYAAANYTIVPQIIESLPSYGVPTLDVDNETSVESNKEQIILNIWNSATSASITAATTSGTITTEYTCITNTGSSLTSPTIAYSLVAGAGSVPEWASIDSSTAEITYNTTDANSTESFSIRATLGGDAAVYYDTAVTLEVTGASAPSGGGGGSGGGSGNGGGDGSDNKNGSGNDDKGCLNSSSEGQWAGIIVAIVIGGLITIALLAITIVVISKKTCLAKAPTTSATPFTPETISAPMTTNQPIPNKP